MAALEVVKRRLDSAGLGDFCLEQLGTNHRPSKSSRASSPSVLIQDTGRGRADVDIAWQEARRDIQTYLNALHSDGDIKSICPVLESDPGTWKSRRSDFFVSRCGPLRAILDTMAGFERAEALLARYVNEWEAFQALFGAARSSPWAKLTYHEAANAGLAFVVTDKSRGEASRR